jgi:hypothetical protein
MISWPMASEPVARQHINQGVGIEQSCVPYAQDTKKRARRGDRVPLSPSRAHLS